MSERTAQELRSAAALGIRANLLTPGRRGNVVVIDAAVADEVMVTGDLHGHVANYERIIELADLDSHPRRHLIMQEVCHGGPCYEGSSACRSHEMLTTMIATKLKFPGRFHFLLSNHELSEYTGHPIAKHGKLVGLTFLLGIAHMYGEEADTVHAALTAFVASCPIAIRIGDGVLVTHSIPENVDGALFDVDVFDRVLRREDIEEGGEVFRMVWGRDFSAANAQRFATLTGATTLINGHVPCAEGFHRPNDRQLVIDCCSTPASYVMVKLDGGGEPDAVAEQIRPLD